MAKFQTLEKNATNWQKARTIEQYVAQLERRVQLGLGLSEQTELSDYIAWAKEKIAWLDPLVARDDPILGRRHDG